jgi:hypothetical protein
MLLSQRLTFKLKRGRKIKKIVLWEWGVKKRELLSRATPLSVEINLRQTKVN